MKNIINSEYTGLKTVNSLNQDKRTVFYRGFPIEVDFKSSNTEKKPVKLNA